MTNETYEALDLMLRLALSSAAVERSETVRINAENAYYLLRKYAASEIVKSREISNSY